jgi:uncharacterized protein (DUF1684 family)
MKLSVLLCAALLLAGCVTNVTTAPRPTTIAQGATLLSEWEKWRATENAAWSTEEFAILKIDDAVYLKDGESAWLTTRRQKMQQYRWQLGVPRHAARVQITYSGGKAKIVVGRKTQLLETDKTQSVALGHGIDVRFALTQLDAGSKGLRVMVYNQAHPAARDFKGLSYFDYNPAAVVEAKVEAAATAELVDFQTSRHWVKRFNRVGTARFLIDGKPVELGLYSDETDPAKITKLSAFFLDDLSGRETYGVGRYFDIDVKGVPERLTIDFNRAYNPNCARSPHYNCPLAKDRIPVALLAGEKSPPKH